MQFKKIVSIFILMSILFVSISAISAEDTNETMLLDTNINNEILTDSDTTIDYYVSNDGSDDNDGSSNSPYKTIEKAVEKSDSNKTTNIHLSDGIYQQEGNVNLTIKNNVNLIGSSAEKTILTGSNTNWLINMENGTLTLKDLTITNFFKSINQSGTKSGIITSNANVDLTNVIISNNIIQTSLGKDEEKSTIYTGVIFSTGKINLDNVTGFNNKINNTLGNSLVELRKLADWGCVIGSFNATRITNSNFYNNSGSRSSVVYAHTLTTLNVLNSKFENNTASYCGGVFLTYLNTNTHISNSIFKNNNGTNAGGIIYQQRYSNLYVDNCTFENNYANTGGSLYAHHYSNLTAINSSFTTGRARTGAAIIGADFVYLTINNCKFENNTASEGAVMGDEGCQIDIDNCVFNNNIATFGAAVFGDMINNITVKNSVLKNNNATYGGAIFGTFESNIKIINNTFIENHAVNGSVVFMDNTGKLDEEPETPAYEGLTSSIYSKDNIFTNNTSEDNLLLVNYENENPNELKETNIITSNVVSTNKKQTLTFTLKDIDGNVLSNKELKISLNGVIYDKKTNENGIATLTTTFLKVGSYDCAICFVGSNNYKSSFATSKIKINEKPVIKKVSKITAKKVTFKSKTKTKKYSITLKSGTKAIKKVKVTLKVKGKTYTSITDSKGKATFKITKLTKKGKYTAVIKFNGNKNYKATTKKIQVLVR